MYAISRLKKSTVNTSFAYEPITRGPKPFNILKSVHARSPINVFGFDFLKRLLIIYLKNIYKSS